MPNPAAVEIKRHVKRVARVYLVVTDIGDGDGVYSVTGSSGQALPVVAVDEKGLGKLAAYAKEQVRCTGRTVSIIGFTKREVHETFRPVATGDKN